MVLQMKDASDMADGKDMRKAVWHCYLPKRGRSVGICASSPNFYR